MIDRQAVKMYKEYYLYKHIKGIIYDQDQQIPYDGQVQYVDDFGQLHGTWGGLAVIPDMDQVDVIDDLK